jgi:hypothetical protein
MFMHNCRFSFFLISIKTEETVLGNGILETSSLDQLIKFQKKDLFYFRQFEAAVAATPSYAEGYFLPNRKSILYFRIFFERVGKLCMWTED